jgi:hypothetical protein
MVESRLVKRLIRQIAKSWSNYLPVRNHQTQRNEKKTFVQRGNTAKTTLLVSRYTTANKQRTKSMHNTTADRSLRDKSSIWMNIVDGQQKKMAVRAV